MAHLWQPLDELFGISVLAGLLYERSLLALGQVGLVGAEQAECDVFVDSTGEKHWFLLY